MLFTCLGATDYGDANAEATNEKEALDFNEFNKVLIFFSLSQHCYDYRHLSILGTCTCSEYKYLICSIFNFYMH